MSERSELSNKHSVTVFPAVKRLMSARARLTAALAGCLVVGSTAGCGPTILGLPRPGGDVSGRSYGITARFADALNLPDGAQVRVGGTAVGRVQRISTHNFVADVAIRLPRRVVLTDQAAAELRLTTPLGEGFIDIDPGHGAHQLADGGLIDTTATSTAASVEDMLAAASVLISGGGLGQLRTIAVEMQKVIDGRHGDPRRLLNSLNDTLSVLNARSADIDKTLDALDTLSGTLVARRATLRAALHDAAPAAKLLADQTDKFSQLLAGLAKLGKVGDRVVRATRDDIVDTLRSAQPVLDALISVEKSVGPTLAELIKFGKFLDSTVPGDYLAGDLVVSDSSFQIGPGAPAVPDLTLGHMMRAQGGGQR
jgi:phospholipid/cholesterol/gamma-HCH transport system substrate-binding protein